MNTAKTLEIPSDDAESTIAIGVKIGRRLNGGEVIELISDIGGGKTTFVKGLAEGIDSRDKVTSPTFTLSRIYRSDTRPLMIHHYDFYRLEQPGVLAAQLEESIQDPAVIVVIEWSGIVRQVLPEKRLTIRFLVDEVPDHRRLLLKVPADWQYLIRKDWE